MAIRQLSSEDVERQKFFFDNIYTESDVRSRPETETIGYHVIDVRPIHPPHLIYVSFVKDRTNGVLKRLYNLFTNFIKIAALNFASADQVGGGVKNGRSAQEETMVRLALAKYLYLSLAYAKTQNNVAMVDLSTINRNITSGPALSALYYSHIWSNANWNRWVLYTPDVIFDYKEDPSSVIPIICKPPYRGSVISAAAPNNGRQTLDQALGSIPQMKVVMHNILKVAYDNGCKILVLGAWGCGVYAPKESSGSNRAHEDYVTAIAKAFGEVLCSSPYSFLHVCFPIDDDRIRDIFQTQILAAVSNAIGGGTVTPFPDETAAAAMITAAMRPTATQFPVHTAAAPPLSRVAAAATTPSLSRMAAAPLPLPTDDVHYLMALMNVDQKTAIGALVLTDINGAVSKLFERSVPANHFLRIVTELDISSPGPHNIMLYLYHNNNDVYAALRHYISGFDGFQSEEKKKNLEIIITRDSVATRHTAQGAAATTPFSVAVPTKVQVLLDIMKGVTPKEASNALKINGDDIERAANYLLSKQPMVPPQGAAAATQLSVQQPQQVQGSYCGIRNGGENSCWVNSVLMDVNHYLKNY